MVGRNFARAAAQDGATLPKNSLGFFIRALPLLVCTRDPLVNSAAVQSCEKFCLAYPRTNNSKCKKYCCYIIYILDMFQSLFFSPNSTPPPTPRLDIYTFERSTGGPFDPTFYLSHLRFDIYEMYIFELR